MPRRGRKQLVLVDEDQLREDREEGYRRLAVELRRAWLQAHISSASRQR
jgi:hypothetical protein